MNLLLAKSYVAGAAIAANRIVKFDAADNTVIQAAAAADLSIGVTNNLPVTATERVDVIHSGIADVKLGAGGITRGASVTADATGQGIAVAATGRAIGIALASGVAGDIVPVLIAPHVI